MILLKKVTKMKTVGWGKQAIYTQADNITNASFLIKITILILAVKLKYSSIREINTYLLISNTEW